MQENSKPVNPNWNKLIPEWESSGESQKSFCEKRQLNISTFTYWRGKLNTDKKVVPQVKFGEMNIKPASPLLKLNLPNGVCLMIPAGADKNKLGIIFELLGIQAC